MGYMGPRTTPTMETATAPPMRDGTSQTMSSNIQGHQSRQRQPKLNLPNGEKAVNEHDPTFADL